MPNIVVITPPGRYGPVTSDKHIQMIKDVSPGIDVTQVSLWVGEELKGDKTHQSELNAALSEAEVILARALPQDIIKRAPKLQWLQMTYDGMERILKDQELVASPVKLTNARGIEADAISEYVITLILAFAKHLPSFAEQKKQKNWHHIQMIGVAGQTVGILGLGNVGKAVAKRAKALGMHVIAYDRPRKVMRALNVDKLVSDDNISVIFKESDFVVSCLPSTPKTNGIVDEQKLRLMKPTAHFINVSRGAIVKEDALIRALREKWIAGAGLDVFAMEPLPADNPLWELPNVIFSPHCCGRIDNTDDKVIDLFCANLKRYVSGKRLINMVDKRAGF